MSQVNVLATAVALDGKESELEELLRGLVEPSRKDPGCLSYDLHRDIDSPGTFVFYETWTSRALLDAHLKTPHLLDALGKFPALTRSVDVKVLKKLS